jgi:regulator of protease activity HflC (stomatin/prohibitin superfamily)
MIVERERVAVSGWLALCILIPGFLLCAFGISQVAEPMQVVPFITLLILAGILAVCFRGLFIVNPNEAKVLQLFGRYSGTVKEAGLKWANPLLLRQPISQRVRNFESSLLKVNDHDGNPIEIAAVVVWKVVDTAEASFEVDDYEHFVKMQSEAALRNLATRYPYDAHIEGQLSLRGNTAEIADQLKGEIQNRLTQAGVLVLEARIANLSYAPEIAVAMLRRQQASAVIAARQKIVEGAVGMVEMALNALSKQKIVELDEERKAAMVSNLLVVLCSEHETQPVVNAGTLHH